MIRKARPGRLTSSPTDPPLGKPALPDPEFIEIFKARQRTSPGFRLLRENNAYAQKAYIYPLDPEVLQAVLVKVGATDPGAPIAS